MNRRRFILRGTGFLASGLILGANPLKLFGKPISPDLCLVKSTDYYHATLRAIHELGGIRKFVSPGDSVGFLINSAFKHPGTYSHPDIALAMIFLCWEAGAREIVMLQVVKEEYFQRSNNYQKHRYLVDELVQVDSNTFPAEYNEEDFMVMETIGGAVHLKDVEIVRKVNEVDTFINVPILKHHASTILTGALKNMMGLCTRRTNVNFHLGSGVRNDPEYLGRCIADLNLVRKPDLIVADATEFITANGPAGPGPLKKLDLVVAGTDPLSIDAFGAGCLDTAPDEILTLTSAYESGIGEIDLSKLTLLEINT